MNDAVAPQMTDVDWRNAALSQCALTVLRATIVFVVLFWVNRRILRAGGESGRAIAKLMAICAAGLIVVAGFVGAFFFLRHRPVL